MTILIAAAGCAAIVLRAGRQRQSGALASQVDDLQIAARSLQARSPEPSTKDQLPPPVARYLKHVLGSGDKKIRLARYRQTGSLRTDAQNNRWFDFTASQVIAPVATGFIWDARVAILPLVHLRVRDSLLHGHGAGQVALWSAITVASANGNPQMNSGALHRFLAEAVWYPTALLPTPDLRWQPIDDTRALATLTQGEVSVSLEFGFNQADEVVGIYTPGRWGLFDGAFRQVAWEGKFAACSNRQGVLVPDSGEVGWYADGDWHAVWRGTVVSSEFEFE